MSASLSRLSCSDVGYIGLSLLNALLHTSLTESWPLSNPE